ncbi:toprim domain-containing protein [Bacteroides fragilis]|nr:toprim domain-containing protein [Bacteroides fragilis]
MSLARTKEIPADECLVFEGFMDFLSAVTLGVTGNADCLVLELCRQRGERRRNCWTATGASGCFLDRDEAGRRTLDALAKRYGARVADRSSSMTVART